MTRTCPRRILERLADVIIDKKSITTSTEDMIDQNLDLLLNSGEHYKKLENSDQKREIEMIKMNSMDIINKL